jgi:thiol-disulfide isomerase/thioredoxin
MKYIITISISIVLLLIAGCVGGPSATHRIGQKLDDSVISTWIQKKNEFVDANPTLYVAWAHWCPGCVMEIPKLNDFYDKQKNNVNVIGIAAENTDGMKKFAEVKIKYMVAFDEQHRLLKFFESSTIPFMALISPDNEVLWQGDEFKQNEVLEVLIKKKYNTES